MDNAKEIARDMLEAINIDGSGFMGAVAKGLISFPVSLACLVEDVVRPYEMVCEIAKINPEEFNNVCEYFFGGL